MLVSDIVADDLPVEIIENRHLYSSCLAGAISEDAYVEGLSQAGLVNVEVIARQVYDTAQLQAFIGSELKDSGCSCCHGGDMVDPQLIHSWAEQLTGKIASIKVRARKLD